MRLIDADELKEAMLEESDWWENADVWVAHNVIDKAPTIEPVQRCEREINADELLKRLDQYFEDNGLEHKWTGDEIADSMSGTVEDIVRIVKEMLGESDDEDEQTWW
jgi:hypothetical protein